MASQGRPSGWDELPDEILLQVLSYLEPHSITRLQLVSRKLQKFCLDDELWKHHCFLESQWYHSLQNARQRLANIDDDLATPPATQDEAPPADDPLGLGKKKWQQIQDMANWDPVFPDEQVSWYDEYVQRNGPASVNWLQTPQIRDRGLEAIIEARGMALYSPYGGNDGAGTMLAVSPLDDGSVCLWDVKGTRSKQGSIIAQSKPDILFIDGPGEQNAQRSKRIDTGVAECVSVNNNSHRAFFAVQSHLIEVDLNRLQVVNRVSFEWSITTLSPVDDGVPLTVGTTLGIHLHDFRTARNAISNVDERLDGYEWDKSDVYRSLFDPQPLPAYASLSQPTPISILHLPRPGSHSLVSDDIYVSGRFSNILHYDRRKFPAIVGSIYSGAQINTLAALPYPYSTVDNEVRRQGQLTVERAQQAKMPQGRTLIAGGAYNSKGSLELYGLESTSEVSGNPTMQKSTLKNRQTAASGSILSVTNHGTKIAFSDGAGLMKWFERDGTTECRRLKIGHCDMKQQDSLFASRPPSDDLARKIVSTKSGDGTDRMNNDNLLFWTGERLGMVTFTSKPLFQTQDFEGVPPPMTEDDEASVEYDRRMREALERQADEVKFVKSLGLRAET